MPGEGYLEPVVTKLQGDLSDLAKTIAEAKALIKGFGADTEKQTKEDGGKAGKSAGDALMGEFAKAVEANKSKGKLSLDRFLDDVTKEAKAKVAKLGADLRKSGDLDVWKDLKIAEKDLKLVEEAGKDIAKHLSAGIDDGGKTLTASLQGLLSNAVTGAPLVATLVGLLVIGSPLIGAALGGALLAGVAGAGIGVAVAGQINNPIVKHAWDGFTAQAKSSLATATEPLASVFVSGLNRFSQDFQKWEQPLANALDHLAPYVDALLGGVEKFLANAWPGFDDALNASEPVLEGIAEVLPEVGTDFSRMFRAIADGSPGAVDGIKSLLRVIGITAEATGILLEGLEKGYTILVAFGDLLTGNTGDAAARLASLTSNTHSAADANNQLKLALAGAGIAAGNEADAVGKLNDSLEKLIGQNLSADQATIAQKQSLADLTQSIAENGKQWDINTDAGRKNQGALLDAIAAADRKRQADVANGKDAVQAAQDYNQEVQALLDIARKAGDSTAALNDLAGKYEIDVTEYYTTHFINEGTPPSQFYHGLAKGGFAGPGGIIKAASGMLPARSPGTLVLAGEPETGGEWMIPRRGISQQRAATLIASAAADHGLGMGGDGAYLQLSVPLMVDSRQIAEATYEGFVNFGQERKNRRGTTGFE